MKIHVNGQEQEITDGLTVGRFLETLQIRPGRVVIELNRSVLSRDAFGSTALNDGDTVEIVHFVGGG